MKHTDWEAVLDGIEEDMLLDALEKTSPSGIGTKRKALILAAVLALLCALGFTACAVNLFGVRDMLMDMTGGPYVTMAGLQNTNEYQALQEWDDRCPKRQTTIVPETEDPQYHQYGAFSRQAKGILDEILEKYSLKPYNSWTPVYDGDPQSLYDALGCDGFLPESCSTFRGTAVPNMPGCSVRNGGTIFSFSDSTQLPDGRPVNYELNNAAKGYLPIFIGIRIDPDTAVEWHYKSKSGMRLLLCMDEGCSVILADLPDSFLCISAVTTDDNGRNTPLNEESLEAFADLFFYQRIAALGRE